MLDVDVCVYCTHACGDKLWSDTIKHSPETRYHQHIDTTSPLLVLLRQTELGLFGCSKLEAPTYHYGTQLRCHHEL